MDAEFKKLLKGGKWAANGDRAEPGSTNISPSLVRSIGFPVSYSQADGNTPDRRRINQQFRELTGGAFEVVMGISPYDADVDYPLDAISQVQGRLYRAKVANGPGSSNATNPSTDSNEVVWERVSGAVTIPDPPREAIFDNSVVNQLSLRWKNGRDGGERIKTYQLQYRQVQNTAWLPAQPITLDYAQHTISGLASGQVIVVQIRAITDEGMSDWYTTPNDAPNNRVVGNVPSGGNALGLYGEAGDARVRLNWSTPISDGGFPILRYRIQWRTTAQTFSSSNETTIGAPINTSTITGLTNGTLYYFRVSAENSQGAGDWSNIAEATPRAAQQLAVQPSVRSPSASRSGSTITANARWSNSSTAPTATPTNAKWQSRRGTSGSWSNSSHQGLNGFTISNAQASQVYQIRNLLVTSLGETAYSDPTTVPAAQNKATGPGAPSVSLSVQLRSQGSNDYNANVSWSAPNNGGRPIDAYHIRLVWDSGVTRSASASVGRNARSYSFTVGGLSPGTTFTAYVSANNGSEGPSGRATARA